jgi:bifunctional non-homologous end joining protein LigD
MGEITASGRKIKTSSEDRLLFPRDGITKGDIVSYYAAIAAWMLPHLRKRRLTMQRWQKGIDGESFFQKEISDYFPDWVHRVTVPKHGGVVTHVVCDDAATLVYLANQNCLTPHVGLARVDRIDHPDQLVIDLDPAKDDFEIVRSVAFSLKEVLDQIGLVSVIKTTGSRGLHVVIPLDRKLPFEEVREHARQIAGELVRRRPDDTTLEQLIADRGGRLFIDTNRNGAAQTAVPAFAVRARDGAPVAMPISWDELRDPKVNSRTWNIHNALERVKNWSDPWKSAGRPKSLRAATSRLLNHRAA